MQEIWKDVKGYEKSYQISNLGNVKSLYRKINNANGFRYVKEIILKQGLNTFGYPLVGLSKGNNNTSISVHLLVWDHFGNGKRNGKKIQVDHIDNNKLNNNINNLQLLTLRQNVSKSKKLCNKTSKYIGVCWNIQAKKWLSRIRIKNNLIHIGYFKNEMIASAVYQHELENINKG